MWKTINRIPWDPQTNKKSLDIKCQGFKSGWQDSNYIVKYLIIKVLTLLKSQFWVILGSTTPQTFIQLWYTQFWLSTTTISHRNPNLLQSPSTRLNISQKINWEILWHFNVYRFTTIFIDNLSVPIIGFKHFYPFIQQLTSGRERIREKSVSSL